MSIVICWSQRTLKQLEREQTDTQTDTQDDYSNPRACAPRVNKGVSVIQFTDKSHANAFIATPTRVTMAMFA